MVVVVVVDVVDVVARTWGAEEWRRGFGPSGTAANISQRDGDGAGPVRGAGRHGSGRCSTADVHACRRRRPASSLPAVVPRERPLSRRRRRLRRPHQPRRHPPAACLPRHGYHAPRSIGEGGRVRRQSRSTGGGARRPSTSRPPASGRRRWRRGTPRATREPWAARGRRARRRGTGSGGRPRGMSSRRRCVEGGGGACCERETVTSMQVATARYSGGGNGCGG